MKLSLFLFDRYAHSDPNTGRKIAKNPAEPFFDRNSGEPRRFYVSGGCRRCDCNQEEVRGF